MCFIQKASRIRHISLTIWLGITYRDRDEVVFLGDIWCAEKVWPNDKTAVDPECEQSIPVLQRCPFQTITLHIATQTHKSIAAILANHVTICIQRKLFHSSAMCEFTGQLYHLSDSGYKQRPVARWAVRLQLCETAYQEPLIRVDHPQVGNAFIASPESFQAHLACGRQQEK